MSKKTKNNSGMVYSTNPDYFVDSEENEEVAIEPTAQLLTVSLDSKSRKGKTVTLIEGFKGKEEDLIALGKMLKSKCGVGGSAKDSEIIIQGNLKDKIGILLQNEGYRIKFKG